MVRIFKVGDSRTVGQAKARGVKGEILRDKNGEPIKDKNGNPKRDNNSVKDQSSAGIYYYARVGKNFNWLNNNVSEITQKSKDYDAIVVSLGVNDIDNKQKYVAKMKELAEGPWKGKQVYFTAVNPVGSAYKTIPNMNRKIDEFNAYVKKNLPNNVHFIDTNTYFKNNCNCKYDSVGLHYDDDTNKKIDAFVTAEIQKDCAQRGENQQTIANNDVQQPEVLASADKNATKLTMLNDANRARVSTQNGSSNLIGGLAGAMFSGNANDEDPLGMMLAMMLVTMLQSENNSSSTQQNSAEVAPTASPEENQPAPKYIVDHAHGLQLNMSSFDIKSENFARDLARQLTANVNNKSYRGYATAGQAYCAGAGTKSFNEVASKYDVFDMGVKSVGCRDVLAKMTNLNVINGVRSNGESSNCYNVLKSKINANPRKPQVFVLLVDSKHASSGLHYVTVAPRLDKKGEIVRDENGAVQYNVYNFNHNRNTPIEQYSMLKSHGYVFPITEMAKSRELAKTRTPTNNNSLLAQAKAKAREGMA